MRLPKRSMRPSFTLIEILIVIAIIAIILSIALAAYFRVYVLASQLSARSDITQLSVQLDKFKADHGKYPPSRIKLCCQLGSYGTTQLDTDSKAFLSSVFGSRIEATWANPGIDWTGLFYTTGTAGMTATDFVILEGDQCLVFFLGGAQSLNGGTISYMGFSNNPNNPMDSNNGANPYQGAAFQFKGNRLNVIARLTDPKGLFPSYMDSYGLNAYAYLSAYTEFVKANGYLRYYDGTAAGTSDCATLGVWPYAKSLIALSPTGEFQNPETYQIICAGRDGAFGSGSDPRVATPTLWTPGTAAAANPPGSAGADDMSNFHSVLLGISK